MAQQDLIEKHNQVVVRMMGHQILLQAGDSTSRVLPIEKDKGRYLLKFENEFEINPEELVAVIDSIVSESKLAKSYLVEVETCVSNQVVYSYEIGNAVKTDLVPCTERMVPTDCYKIYFTIVKNHSDLQAYFSAPVKQSSNIFYSLKKWGVIILAAVLFALLIFILLWRTLQNKRKNEYDSSQMISLGIYRFDPKNMLLFLKNKKIELSSKETDLLLLLIEGSEKVVEREQLLKLVWGDEGNYIGRTLDVFISKLRKKLTGDPNLKIVNVRGIGYKLIS